MDSASPLPSFEPKPLTIGIAVVLRDGGSRILIRRRPPKPGSPMPGVWEFPGGKAEPGESPDQTAVRECLEESGLAVAVAVTIANASASDSPPNPLHRVVHRYPHGEVDLHYYECVCLDDPDAIRSETGFRWVFAADLPNYRFPDANEAVIELLRRRDGSRTI